MVGVVFNFRVLQLESEGTFVVKLGQLLSNSLTDGSSLKLHETTLFSPLERDHI